jgi:hypothetical protein
MTITRLFFYATSVTCLCWAGMARAYPSIDSAPAAASTVAAPASKTAKPLPSSSHAHAMKTPAKKTGKSGAATEASAGDTYHLMHSTHSLDSYQNAMTPPPATGR